MKIHSGHAEVEALVKRWKSTKSTNPKFKERKSRALHHELMRKIVEPQIKRYEGEFILLHHTFLSRKPTGEHSFARGSTMMSETVYWVTVGRIDGAKLRHVRARTRTVRMEPHSLQFTTAPRFSVPIRNASISLVPRYAPNTHQPHFVILKRRPDEEIVPNFTLDISALGDHLFTLQCGKNDWATKIEIVLGTKAVHAWLTEHGSEETFLALKERL